MRGACIAACRITVPQISPTFHLLVRPANLVALVSFRFISFRFILSHLRLISFHFILCRAQSSALRCAKTRGKRRFLVPVYFFPPRRRFLFGGSLAETWGGDGRRKRRRGVRFYSCRKQYFYCRLIWGEAWGAKVQFRGMFAVPVYAVGAARSSCSKAQLVRLREADVPIFARWNKPMIYIHLKLVF